LRSAASHSWRPANRKKLAAVALAALAATYFHYLEGLTVMRIDT
jgi:hypothetical protein